MYPNTSQLKALVFSAIALSAGACVDHDYDLADDIDLEVNVGGKELTLPSSSTADITLESILDLDAGSSVIKVETEGLYGLHIGDYVLVQDGNSDPADFSIAPVDINATPSTTHTDLPEFVNVGGVKATETAEASVNTINLTNDNVDPQVVSLNSARMDVVMSFDLTYTSNSGFAGTAYIEPGYRAVFPAGWTVEPADAATASFLANDGDNTLVFTRSMAFTKTSPMRALVRLTAVDFSKVEGDKQGLYAPGHFALNSSVESYGDVSLESGPDFPVGASVKLTLVTTTGVERARIIEVTGIVNPDINVDPTDFEISGVPEFLSDEENNLEIENPQIRFVVTNNSPLALVVDGQLTSYSGNNEIKTVGLGEKYGTTEINVAPKATTTFVISRRPVSGNHVNIIVSDLNEILTTVPDRILFHDVEVAAVQQPVTFELGPTYTFNADYEAIVPLAFGSNMTLHYVHEDSGWDEDLEKYNFDTVVLTADAVNTIPLDMTPSAVALRPDGSELTTVTATVEGSVRPGTAAAPSTAPIKITLKSTGKNIKDLDGIKIVFDAKSTPEVAGINLNAGQALRFNNIKIKVIGGITVDLND